jgi:hypothetical protein
MWRLPYLQLTPGIMGPCFRRDDSEAVKAPVPYALTGSGNTAAILVFSVAALKGLTM